MPFDDPRAATAAAIERTACDPIPVETRAESPPGAAEKAVEWHAGGAAFVVRIRDGARDTLTVYRETDVGACELSDIDAYEVDAVALRENLADCGVFERDGDLTVLIDDPEWFAPESDDYRADGTPSTDALERLAADAPFEYRGEIERPGVRAVVSELREIYRIGTAVAGEFAVTDDDLARELWSADGLQYARGDFHLGEAFLRSNAVAEFFADASPDGHLDGRDPREPNYPDAGGGFPVDDGERSFERTPLVCLDGRVARSLLMGGAYEEFAGDREEAKALGVAFSHAMRAGEWGRHLTAYTGWHPWSDWFVYTDHWDTTVIVEDREAKRIRLFAATDSD